MDNQNRGLSPDDLDAESAVALPDKEVVSILDLNADLDLAIDAAAPIDLSVAANANVAAPIDAAVGANVLSEGSTAQALADQGTAINQDIDADAVADSSQDSTLDQGAGDAVAPSGTEATDAGVEIPTDTSGALDGGLLNVDVNLDGDVGIAAPINGAVAANANVAAPIDAALGANIGSVDSEATAVAQQDAIIDQSIEGSAEATADQSSDITQP